MIDYHFEQYLRSLGLGSAIKRVLMAKCAELVEEKRKRQLAIERNSIAAERDIPLDELPTEERALVTAWRTASATLAKLQKQIDILPYTVYCEDLEGPVRRKEDVREVRARDLRRTAEWQALDREMDDRAKKLRDVAMKFCSAEVKAIKIKLDATLLAELDAV